MAPSSSLPERCWGPGPGTREFPIALLLRLTAVWFRPETATLSCTTQNSCHGPGVASAQSQASGRMQLKTPHSVGADDELVIKRRPQVALCSYVKIVPPVQPSQLTMALLDESYDFKPATRDKVATCSYIDLPDVDDVFVDDGACYMDWKMENAAKTDSFTIQSVPHSDEEHIPDLSKLNLESPRGDPHLTPKLRSLELKPELTFDNQELIPEYSGETDTQPMAQAQSAAPQHVRLGPLLDGLSNALRLEVDQGWNAWLEPINAWLEPLKMWF
ncbi:predicted protein [Postia placenta Mad-698-R]|nr:predicted protein [Postia placenta Mad-698-R]